MLTAFDHVTIVVRELDAAVSAYQALLGFAPVWRGEHPELGTRAALFSLGNALLELVGPVPNAPQAEGMRALLDAQGEGIEALAFATEDAAACSATLRERGMRATPPQEGEALGPGGERRVFRTVELSPRSTRGLHVFAVQRPDREQLTAAVERPADTVSALDHVVVRTSAPDAALGLYRDALGIRLALDAVIGGARMLFFRIGAVTVEVVHDVALDERDSFFGLAYRVQDLDAAHARVRSAGFDVSEVRAGHKPGTRVFTVRTGTCSVPTLFLHDPARTGA
jgi:catechol 2,3-dioxygenase-like lactoylglutathione lyase family enzyme